MTQQSPEYQRAWKLAHPGKSAEYSRMWRLANPGKAAEQTNKWRVANRVKVSARDKAAWAVKCGDLIPQPCEVCGSTDRIDAHHEDYDKPLDIMWLCKQHHKDRHRYLRALKKMHNDATRQLPSWPLAPGIADIQILAGHEGPLHQPQAPSLQ